MTHQDDERCVEARRLQRLDAAFANGNLQELRVAVGDPAAVPNGPMPVTVGNCLVYAIYRSPLGFIRTLLEIGADPRLPVDDGFPPLIAALSCGRDVLGARKRTDVDDLIRLLLSFGADPHQRGINDYTALHMAVVERQALAVQMLLDSGADPDLPTRIDQCETPLQTARAAGLTEIAAILERRGGPLGRRLKSGLTLLTEITGNGEPVRRQHVYRMRLRLWLSRGDSVRWPASRTANDTTVLLDRGETLVTDVRIERRSLISGLFYGVEGMRVGGTRRLEIAPHLGYAARGVPDVIPPHAVLTAEITILGEREQRGAR